MEKLALIKKYWYVFLILLLFVLVPLVLWILGKPIKYIPQGPGLPLPTSVETNSKTIPAVVEPPLIDSSPELSLSATTTYTIGFTNTFPSQGYIYKKIIGNITEGVARSIAQNFSFKTQPTTLTASSGKVWDWVDTNNVQTLHIHEDTNYIQYNNAYAPEKGDVDSKPIKLASTPEEIIAAAKDFVQKHKISEGPFPPESINIEYFVEFSESPQTTDFSNAQSYKVDFFRNVEGQKIFQQYGVTESITVFVDKFKTITQLSYYYNPIPSDVKKSVTLLSSTEIKSALEQGKGVIVQPVQFRTPQEDTLSIEPVSIHLTSAELTYLDTFDSPYIQPLFVLTGTASLNTGKEQEVIIYLPASKN